MLSDPATKYMRHIDRITVKGSKTPMDIYTCDFDVNRIVITEKQKNQFEKALEKKDKKIIRVVERRKKIERIQKILKYKL